MLQGSHFYLFILFRKFLTQPHTKGMPLKHMFYLSKFCTVLKWHTFCIRKPTGFAYCQLYICTNSQNDFLEENFYLLDLNIHMHLYGNPQNTSVALLTIVILHNILNYLLMIEWSCAFAGMLGSPVLLI